MSRVELPPETLRCPTCRAVQEWSDECRRCRCDLRLLREIADLAARSRTECLRLLAANEPRRAVAFARDCVSLLGDPSSSELLVVAALLAEDWVTARDVAATLDGREP